ncbi:protein SHQ1 homolog [Musca autumnalis]|uniref:protein SHQ1 homolog n=1 Tax=Musca autumnalis TaxID=221902 RepID=UPI003CEFE776
MTNLSQISHSYREDVCELEFQVRKAKGNAGGDGVVGRFVENVRNCDIFIEDYHVLVYLDVQLYKFRSSRRFDMKDLKNIYFTYDTKDSALRVSLPCLPHSEEERPEKNSQENKTKNADANKNI